MNKVKLRIISLILLLCALGFLVFALVTSREEPLADPSPTPPSSSPEVTATPSPTPTATPEPTPTPTPTPAPIEIRITAVGDNILHTGVTNYAKTETGYDYTPIYRLIKPIIEGSDIAYVNQEAMLTGKVSGYPRFSGPFECSDSLIDTGFNVINLANNHSMDQGGDGLLTCLDSVYERPFDAVLGAFKTEEDSQKLIIIEKKGITFGFLSYTYGLNGLPLPEGKPWMVSLIDREKIKKDVAEIRPLCDYLIVSMHWGEEYQAEPNQSQKDVAQILSDGGVDLIIGMHPHVLQAAGTLTGTDGNKTLCVYSLGNFISSQERRDTMLGGLMDVTLVFDPETKEHTVQSFGVLPLVTHYESGKTGFLTVPLPDYTEELAAVHGIRQYTPPMTLEYLNQLADERLGAYRTDS